MTDEESWAHVMTDEKLRSKIGMPPQWAINEPSCWSNGGYCDDNNNPFECITCEFCAAKNKEILL